MKQKAVEAVEASELGLKPGEFPDNIVHNGCVFTSIKPVLNEERELLFWEYINFKTREVLHIFND